METAVTTKIFDLEHLHMNLDANKELRYDGCAQFFEGLDVLFAKKTQILNTVQQAYNNTDCVSTCQMNNLPSVF